MSTQRYISTSFWTDKWVRELDPSERYLYLYFLTNPQTNIAGVYQITLDRVAFDTGYDERTLRPMIERFQKAGKAYFYNDEWVILPTWPKHQKADQRSKIKAGIDAIIKELPPDIVKFLKKTGYRYLIDTLSVPYAYGSNYSDSDSDSDSEFDTDTDLSGDPHETEDSIFPDDPPTPKPEKQEKSGKAATTTTTTQSAFRPPKVEEVAAYCTERKNGINPEQFRDYYESKGWMIGKNKMKDWRAAVRTWERNEIQQPRASPGPRDFANELIESRTKRAREIFGKGAAL